MKKIPDDVRVMPVLTAEDAEFLTVESGFGPHYEMIRQAIDALADGRTVNVRVLTEDECRAEFEAWAAKQLLYPTERDQAMWLACARAMGAVR